MPSRTFATVVLVAALATGCTKPGKLIAGGTLLLAGAVLANQPNSTVTRDSLFGGTYQDESHGNDILGGAMVVSGVIALLAGLASRDESDEPRTVTLVPEPYTYVPAPVYAEPVYAEPAPPHPVVIDAPSAQTVIYANTVVVQNAPTAEP